jgi:hypothetical protein
MGGAYSTNGGDKDMLLKLEGRRPLERPKWRWVDNIRMDRGEIVWGGVDWIDRAQDRDYIVESSCELSNKLPGSIKCWKTIEWLHSW